VSTSRDRPTPTVVFACRDSALEIVGFLHRRGDLVAVVVLDDEEYRARVADLVGLRVPLLTWPDIAPVEELLEADASTVVVSALFAHKIPRRITEAARIALNLHPGFLPHNKGRGAVMWSIIDGTQAGITAHVMTEEFDKGAILWQRRVAARFDDDGDSLTERVLAAGVAQFCDTWPEFLDCVPLEQDPVAGNYHSAKDCAAVTIGEDEFHTIDKIRAKTYEGGGLVFERDGKTYEIRAAIRELSGDYS
jgi:methionyl-tRNA formyltransferase